MANSRRVLDRSLCTTPRVTVTVPKCIGTRADNLRRARRGADRRTGADRRRTEEKAELNPGVAGSSRQTLSASPSVRSVQNGRVPLGLFHGSLRSSVDAAL